MSSHPDTASHRAATVSTEQWFNTLAEASLAAANASDPEAMIRELVGPMLALAGDRDAWTRPGNLKPGERQFYVGGCFMVTPDEAWHMLVGNVGFPAEQRRLMIPIDGGHPAHVRDTGRALLLANTDEHGNFKQYLKTSRMGSSIYAPLLWKGRFVGQLIMASQARNTFAQQDLEMLRALSGQAVSLWMAMDGPAWLARDYPPADGFKVTQQGM
jgi:GAF domain-containing protein